MKTYHVTVTPPPVWIEVMARDDDEAAEKAMALADRALLGVWFDGHAPGDDDATIGFCSGASDHGPFDFGDYDITQVADDDGFDGAPEEERGREPGDHVPGKLPQTQDDWDELADFPPDDDNEEYEDFGPVSDAGMAALRARLAGAANDPHATITAAINVAYAEGERRTAAIYRRCGVAREESLPIDDMIEGGVPQDEVAEWDRWCVAFTFLNDTRDGWDCGDLISADADEPDLTGWAWRTIREWPSGETVAVRYTDEPVGEWPVRWRNERDGRWYTMRRI